eukprot:tig00020556_g10989.t1
MFVAVAPVARSQGLLVLQGAARAASRPHSSQILVQHKARFCFGARLRASSTFVAGREFLLSRSYPAVPQRVFASAAEEAHEDAGAQAHEDEAPFGSFSTISFYKLFDAALADNVVEVDRHKAYIKENGLDIRGRIYISVHGVNGQMSGPKEDCEAYMGFMKADARYDGTRFTVLPGRKHVFPRLAVKAKQQLVASFDGEVDLAKRGPYLTPKEWRETLENPEEDFVLVDVRNDYEWQVGHFEAAKKESLIFPRLKTFREFTEYADDLKKSIDPKKKLLMCCTGGIRCEIYSAFLKERGFENVFQLKGGIINYGLEEGDAAWVGKLFVFDDRMVVPLGAPSGEEAGLDEAVFLSDELGAHAEAPEAAAAAAAQARRVPDTSRCRHCGTLTDKFTTCANVDCNLLYLCCDACYEPLLLRGVPDGARLRPPTADRRPYGRIGQYGLHRNKARMSAQAAAAEAKRQARAAGAAA